MKSINLKKLTALAVLLMLAVPLWAQKNDVEQPAILMKADSLYRAEQYVEAQAIYYDYAIKHHDVKAMHKAALSYEKQTGNSYCLFLKEVILNGFEIREEELFFFGCNPETFEKIKPVVR